MAISNEQLLASVKKNPLIVVCLVVALLIGVGMYLRAGLEAELTAELEEKSRIGQRMTNNLKFSVRLEDQLAVMVESREKMESRLVDEGQLAVNLQYFYALESSTGTQLTDLRQMSDNSRVPDNRKKQGKTTYQPISYAVALIGNYEQVMSFLQQLETGAHFGRVMNASLVPSAGGGIGGAEPKNANRRSDMLTLTLSLELLGQP